MSTTGLLARLPAPERQRLEPVLDALLEELVRAPRAELERLAPHLTGEDEGLRSRRATCCARSISGAASSARA